MFYNNSRKWPIRPSLFVIRLNIYCCFCRIIAGNGPKVPHWSWGILHRHLHLHGLSIEYRKSKDASIFRLLHGNINHVRRNELFSCNQYLAWICIHWQQSLMSCSASNTTLFISFIIVEVKYGLIPGRHKRDKPRLRGFAIHTGGSIDEGDGGLSLLRSIWSGTPTSERFLLWISVVWFSVGFFKKKLVSLYTIERTRFCEWSKHLEATINVVMTVSRTFSAARILLWQD